jgi:iron-sulfur cluster assembly protein
MAVSLTDNAKSRVRALVAEHNDGKPWLRLRVASGGCSGMMYEMDWVSEPAEGDKTFEFDDVHVCVDRKSYLFLNGIEVDFEDSLVRSGFVFINPAAKRSCSCGESFTV